MPKREAEEANLGKTRFLAAASHDILQPLNAARLYTSAWSSAQVRGGNGELSAMSIPRWNRWRTSFGPSRHIAARRRRDEARAVGLPDRRSAQGARDQNSRPPPPSAGSP